MASLKQRKQSSQNNNSGKNRGNLTSQTVSSGDSSASLMPVALTRTRQGLTPFDRKVMASLKKQAEPSYWDSGFSATGIDFSGGISDLCDVPQGDTDLSRTGDQVTPMSVEIRANVVVGDTTNLVRFILFRWNEPSTPTASQILLQNATANAPLAHYVADNLRQGRFEVLKDTLFTLDAAHVNAGLELKIKLPEGRAMAYTAGGTTGSGKLWVLWISDSGGVPNPQVAMQTRFVFVNHV